MNRSGMAIVVVLFFSFAVSIVLSVLISSNSQLGFQNKQTLYNLQAYYLAQSGKQHALLKLRLLPRETQKAIDGTGADFSDVTVLNSLDLALTQRLNKNYDLFKTGCDDGSPYCGEYSMSGNLEYLTSLDGMRSVQDGYRIKIISNVKHGGHEKVEDEITEEVFVSRFTGGLKDT